MVKVVYDSTWGKTLHKHIKKFGMIFIEKNDTYKFNHVIIKRKTIDHKGTNKRSIG
jgi:hypothetical protein